MKSDENYWIDDNGNKWTKSIETEESADKKSKTLTNCENCVDCLKCSWCSGCSWCSWCSGCSECKNFKSNPQRYVTGNIGSRYSQTSFYWLKDQPQVVCGCYKGTLEEFEKRVKEVHGKSKYGKQYEKEIKRVKMLMKD